MIKNTNKDWFQEEYGFFGDFYYIADNSNEGAYKHYNESRDQRTDREVRVISELLKYKKGDSLFDWPCGWGRHSLRLAQEGLQVMSMDINKKYLSMFEDALQKESNEVRHRVTIKRNDLRLLPDTEEKFDFGINMFSSFGFFDDKENIQVLKNFYAMLKPNGKMLIYLDFNASRLIDGIDDDYAPERTIYHDGAQYNLKVDKYYSSEDKRLHGRWVLINGTGDKVEKTYSFRIYSNDEIKKLLLSVGFRDVLFYSTNLKELTYDSIDTVILACK